MRTHPAIAPSRSPLPREDREDGTINRFDLPPRPSESGPTGFIILRLAAGSEHWADPEIKTLKELTEKAQLTALRDALDSLDLGDGRRLIIKTSPERIREFEARAKRSEFPPIHSLLSYWLVDARRQIDRLEDLVKRLSALPGVDHAYPHSTGAVPVVDPTDDTYAGTQGYLDAAPTGIDAR
jgi:hypothetical protein